MDLAAWRILGRPPGSTDWPRVREWFASHGWCDGAPGAGPGPRLRPLPAPPRVDAARGPALDLVAAWKALAPLHDAAAAAAWWMRRGVDEASALELARVPDLIHLPGGRPPRDLPPHGARLWGLCAATRSAPRRPLLYMVRDDHGAPRGAQRRVGPGADPAAPKSAALPSEALPGAIEGRPHLLGCVRTAAAALAAGRDLALVEGEVDHAVAVAAGWVALGATGASGLRHAAAALVDALRSLEIEATGLGCVHLVAHVGDTPTPAHPGGAGAEYMTEAGDALRAAGIPTALVDLPRRPDGRGDLGDVAEGRSGPRAVVGTLPALDAVRAVLASGVRLSGPALALDVDDARRRVLPDLLGEAKRLAGPDKLVMLGIPMGVGKTHAAAVWAAADLAREGMAAAVDLARAGLSVVFATPNHALAREVVEHAKRGGVAPSVVIHAKGLTAADDDGVPLCKALAAAAKRGEGEGNLFRRALATEGRSVCMRCDWAAGCPVTGRVRPTPGEVVVMPVHMLPHLEAGSTHFVVLDDCGKDEAESEASRHELEAMRPGTLPGARLGDLAPLVDVLGQSLDRAHLAHLAHIEAVEAAADEARACGGRAAPRRTADDVGYRLTGEALAAALAPLRAAAVDWAAAAESPDPWAAWPDPVVGAIGGGVFVGLQAVPDRAALEALCMAVAMVLDQPVRGHLAVCLDRAGWALEIRQPPDLPAGAAVVALDGSAARAPLQWGSVARRTGRTLVDLSMTVLSAPSVPYHWRQGKGLNVSRLGTRTGGGFVFSDEAAGELRAALAGVLEALALRPGQPLPSVGVVTHKALAVAMRKALGEPIPAKDRAGVHWDDAAAAVGEVACDLAKHCGGLVVGHYGADDRGTNRFNAVGVLAVLGCPRPPLAALEATADAMGVDDPRALVAERVAETLAQAVARARHLSNRDLVAIVGCADAPAPAGPDLPGLEPTTTEASTGDWAAWPRAVRLAGLRVLADERGELLPADGDPREIEAVARALEWTCYPVGAPGGGPRRLAWAPPLGRSGEGSKDCRSNDSGHLASFCPQSGRVELHDFTGEVGAPPALEVGGGTAAPLFSIRTEAKNPVSMRNHSTEDVSDPPAAAPSVPPPGRSTARLPFEDDDDEWGGPPAPVEQPEALPVEALPVDPLPAKRLGQTTPLGAAARLALGPVLAAFREVDNARPPTEQPLPGDAPPSPAAAKATTWPPAAF